MVYHTWRFTNWTWSVVLIMVLPGKSITGKAASVSAQGKEILCVWGSAGGKGGFLFRFPLLTPCWSWRWFASDPPISPHHIWGIRHTRTVSPDGPPPLPSSTGRRLLCSVHLCCYRVGRPYLPSSSCYFVGHPI